jgi:PKD repeat protein
MRDALRMGAPKTASRPQRARSIVAALIVALAIALVGQIGHAGSLSSVAPAGASAGVAIAITGTGFDPTAGNNTVTFTPASGTPATVTGTSIVTLDAGAGLRRLSVAVPGGLPAGTTALRVVNKTTGETSVGRSLEVLTLALPAVSSGAPGATNLAVRVTGSPNVRFAAGSTRAAFGAGITVSSTTVESPTSLVATIAIASSAALGARDVSVLTSTQTARLSSGFLVASPPQNHPPVANAGASQAITLPDGANLLGTITDDGLPVGGTLTSQWTQVSGPGHATFASAAVAATSVTFDEPGTYVLRLTANDSALTASGDVTITVNPRPNRSPQGHATAPASATAGAPVQFDATGSIDPDQDMLAFSWDFGDQTSDSGAAPTHVYQTAGSFTVTLTVDDGRGGVDNETLQIQIAPAAIGRGFITGRVLGDSDGLPLQGAVTDLRSGAQAVTDAAGRFRFTSSVGIAHLGISKDGYTSVDRAVAVVDGKRVDPLDARLTPVDAKATTVTSVLGATATNAAGEIRLAIPAGALDADAAVTLTRISGQGLIAPLPAGWSPAVSVDVAPAARAIRSATLSVPAPPNISSDSLLLLARWDGSAGAWIAVANVTRSADGASLQATLSQTGQYSFVVPDPAPAGPPRPPIGQALAAGDATTSDATVVITPSPKILFASSSAHAQVRVAATPAGDMSSGARLRLDVAESYSVSGGTLFVMRTPRLFTLYRFSPALPAAGAPAPLESRLVASPSRLFGPFQLQHGAIDLAARLPGGEPGYGALLPGGAGQLSASTGEQIVVPPGAATGDLPVALSRIDTSDLPPILPTGFSVVGAAELDLHGAALARSAVLSIPTPAGFQAGTQVLVLRITEVGGLSYPELVATAVPQGASLATSTDPLGTGALRFPGIQREGWYIFAQPNQAVGFVNGVASAADGSPIVGALVTGGALGVAAVTDADGRYTMAAVPGAAAFTTTNVATGDETTFGAQVIASAVASQSVSVGQTPFAIASITPSDGASAIALAASIRLVASALVDPASVANAVSLTAGGTPVPGTLTLSADGRTLVFRPGTLLASNTAYQIVVGGLRSANGQPLASAAVAHFATVNLAPPPIPAAGAVTATIPDANNISFVAGSQGTSEPGGLVLIRNLRTGAITTLTPNGDGSFAGSVPTLRTDHLQLTLQTAAGTTTTVPMPVFRNADGSVIVGTAGGRVDGPAGTFADVPPGALPDGSVVKVDVAQPADFGLDAPAGFPFAGGLRLDLGGARATQEIHVGVQAPAGASSSDQVLVAMPVSLPLHRAWTVIDRAHLIGDRYVSQSPPFPGVTGAGTFAFLHVEGDCVSYVSIRYNFNNAFLMADLGMPFFYPTEIFFQQVTLPKVCNATVNVQVLDPNTEAEVQGAAFLSPAAKDDIFTPPDILTDDTSVPTVIRVNNPNGQAVNELQVVFSKAMQPDLVQHLFAVHDSRGQTVAGTIELDDTSTIVTFHPTTPFLLGEHYSVVLFGLADTSGNLLDTQPLTFTPFDPRSLALLAQESLIEAAMSKCSPAGCSTAATDVAFIGHTLFIANGLRSAQEQYRDPANPQRLLALDVSDAFHPQIIGFDATTTNPRALATIEGASFVAQPEGTVFNGNLLVVAGGGRVPAGDLSGELAVYDVTRCTQAIHVGNCLAGALRGFKLLSTAPEATPLVGVPPESGVPLQVAALHQKGAAPNSDIALAYAVVAGVGLEAVDITTSFNLSTPNSSRAPDGLLRGDYLDVGVLKNRVVATGRDNTTNEFRLSLFTGQLGHLIDIPPPPPPGLTALAGAARVGVGENFTFDVDGDGRLGTAEDADGDPTTALQELFDLAIVSSGPISTGCPGDAPPCGELYVVDLSHHTDLAHAGGPRILDVIPLPGSPFSVQVDSSARLAYVEIRGRGVAIVDLNYLLAILRGSSGPLGFTDRNGDGVDDRVLRIVPTGAGQNDIAMTRLKVDTNRGIAFISGATTGVQLLQIANQANELALDFSDPPPADRPTLGEEKARLRGVIDGAATALHGALDGQWPAVRTADDPVALPIYVLEQGSGSCFWRIDGDPARACRAFHAGLSDHDLEFFVPKVLVAKAQDILDNYREGPNHPPDIDTFGDLSMFAMPREAFLNAELLNGTPLYRTGDTSGDLGMGRQTLLLLWILEGQYVPDYEGPALATILAKLKAKPASGDPIFPAEQPREPSGIPRVEGYEWARLQEYNFYKTGAPLRIVGECDATRSMIAEVSDAEAIDQGNSRDLNFDDRSILGSGCKDTIHGVAKAAVRAALARIIADPAGNPLVLEIAPPGGNDLAEYAKTACFDLGAPPFDLSTIAPFTASGTSPPTHGCGSFEEYIATVALKTAQRGLGIFEADQLVSIVRFWCAKVDCDSGAAQQLVTSDDDANAFIREAFGFIRRVEADTLDAFRTTVRNDTKEIGDIPYLTEGPAQDAAPPAPGIGAICGSALQWATGSGLAPVSALLTGVTLPATIGAAQPRWMLRLCNVVVVEWKTNGQPVDPSAQTPPALKFFQMDDKKFKPSKKAAGASKFAAKALQVRAKNLGGRRVSVDLTMFEGDGVDPHTYSAAKTVPLILDSGDRRVIAKEADPDHVGRQRPVFPVLFGTTQPELTGSKSRAIAFFLDPDNKIPEADKKDNQADFAYYVLDVGSGQSPAAPSPPPPAAEETADPLAIPQSQLSFTFRVRSVNGGSPYGGKDVTVPLYTRVELKYELKNLGPKELQNVEVARQVGSQMQIVAQVGRLRPSGQPGDSAFFTDSAGFTALEAGVFTLRAVARAKDTNGNTVGPENDLVYITATEAIDTFDVKLHDASPLAAADHPFSRVAVNTGQDGHSLSLVGATTDGDDENGGAHIRVVIDGLKADRPAIILVADGELPGVTDGVGVLTADRTLQTTVQPDITGHAEVDYFAPPVFVRDAHRADDFPKIERIAKIVVAQTDYGSTTRLVRLRRPPVFLAHGLFSKRAAWNDFQPLVPPTGVAAFASSVPVPGFDGRFDVFAVGRDHPTDPFAVLAPALRGDIKAALASYLPGFAVGKIDVVAHSMGGILASKIATEDPKIASAIRKLITLDSPFGGTALANKLVEIRETNPISSIDIEQEAEDGIDPFDAPESMLGLPGGQKLKLEIDWCALVVRAIGLTPSFYLKGAVDDFKIDSAELAALRRVVVPTHRVAFGTNRLNLLSIAPTLSINGLWAGMGLLCGITPDATTVEWTQNLINAKQIITTLLSMGSSLAEEEAAERLKGILEVLESTLKMGVKQLLQPDAPPTPVFAGDNDRIVEGASQLGAIPVDDSASTTFDGDVDHSSVINSSGASVAACLAGNDFLDPPQIPDVNGDGVRDIVCRVMRLLEADPTTNPVPPAKRLFFKSQ